jgi:hypothetical protein
MSARPALAPEPFADPRSTSLSTPPAERGAAALPLDVIFIEGYRTGQTVIGIHPSELHDPAAADRPAGRPAARRRLRQRPTSPTPSTTAWCASGWTT